MKLFTIRDEENRGKTGDKQPTRSRKGIILVGIIIVLVIGIGLYIFSSMMSGPGMTDFSCSVQGRKMFAGLSWTMSGFPVVSWTMIII